MSVLTDISQATNCAVPEIIGGHRPDIIARSSFPDFEMMIAEAKTRGDIDNQHTRNQMRAFVDHLHSRRRGIGTFILAVYGSGAVVDARNLLRYELRRQVSPELRVHLFDGNDFWALGGQLEALWRLC